jgi:hypothetical protein
LEFKRYNNKQQDKLLERVDTHYLKKTEMKIIQALLFVLLFAILSCREQSVLEKTLEYAGNNRHELERVLQHYRNDSLRLKAAVFLIENMPGHYSYSDTTYRNSYYFAIDSVALLYKNKEDKVKDSLFRQTVSRFNNLKSNLVEDIHIIQADYLINHIDRAFYSWEKGNWAQQLNFNEFCEYLLPYKVCEAQSLDNWRDYMSIYGDTIALNRLQYCQLYKNSAYIACRTMNWSLNDSVRKRINNENNYIPVRKISTLLKVPYGICEDYNIMAIALMRAYGIPCMMDFTPLRKYPPFESLFSVAHRIVGGKIQIASDSLFTDSLTLHTITELGTLAREIDLSNVTDSARYWRYFSPRGGYCNISELFFYKKDAISPIMGKIIGTSGSGRNDGRHNREAAFDRDVLTFFHASQSNDCWVGLDFGKPMRISKIVYFPRNDGNCIEIGDEYELFYWSNHQWQSLGKKKADHVRLDYDNCPANALFLLRNHTKGKEERIFTYENGEQIWW